MNDLSSNGSIVSYETWVFAIASSACIGFTSLVPWLFNLTFFERSKASTSDESQDFGDNRMKYLLSFAIGAILGDIFFHLIPESVESVDKYDNSAHRNVGVSIIAGILMFIIVEMVLQRWSSDTSQSEPGCDQKLLSNVDDEEEGEGVGREKDLNGLIRRRLPSCSDKVTSLDSSKETNNNNIMNNNEFSFENRYSDITQECPLKLEKSHHKESPAEPSKTTVSTTTSLPIDPAGYLNLIANGFDNFTHGLAIGASFLVGPKVGLLTTFVIIIHEIPHEICDYAILVKSGFSRWDAVKAQSSVSLFGILGTATALYVKSIDKLNARTSWILPFSAGGFLYIALVTLLPDILDKETSFLNSTGQIICVISGIAFMGAVALF